MHTLRQRWAKHNDTWRRDNNVGATTRTANDLCRDAVEMLPVPLVSTAQMFPLRFTYTIMRDDAHNSSLWRASTIDRPPICANVMQMGIWEASMDSAWLGSSSTSISNSSSASAAATPAPAPAAPSPLTPPPSRTPTLITWSFGSLPRPDVSKRQPREDNHRTQILPGVIQCSIGR